MPPRGARGGRLGVTGAGSAGPVVQVKVTIDADRTTDAFKRVRRDINGVLRDAQQKVGERTVLPPMRQNLRAVAGHFADSLRVQRDRLDVVIGSSLPKAENRALGWLDFGGQRPQDTRRRIGPHIITSTLADKQDEIRDQIGEAVLDEFRHAGFEVR